jgi:hypothetical protein
MQPTASSNTPLQPASPNQPPKKPPAWSQLALVLAYPAALLAAVLAVLLPWGQPSLPMVPSRVQQQPLALQAEPTPHAGPIAFAANPGEGEGLPRLAEVPPAS